VAPAVHPAYAQQVVGMEVDDNTSLAHLLDVRAQLFPGAAEHDITLVDAATVVGFMPMAVAGLGVPGAAEEHPECSLCMAEFGAGTAFVRPGCCHNATYCHGCACAAVRLRNTCPFCIRCMVCHQAGCTSYHHL
jgi:hypothetical protein